MPAGKLRRTAECTTALALLLALGTACASKARTAGQPPLAPPPVAAAQPSTPATTTPPAAADPKMPAGLPADHVKDKDGVMHKRGYKRPFGDCTSCHGKDLRGEGRTPSCYQCHGKEWH